MYHWFLLLVFNFEQIICQHGVFFWARVKLQGQRFPIAVESFSIKPYEPGRDNFATYTHSNILVGTATIEDKDSALFCYDVFCFDCPAPFEVCTRAREKNAEVVLSRVFN
jgi:hypothetical protein